MVSFGVVCVGEFGKYWFVVVVFVDELFIGIDDEFVVVVLVLSLCFCILFWLFVVFLEGVVVDSVVVCCGVCVVVCV